MMKAKIGYEMVPPFKIKAWIDEAGEETKEREKLDRYLIEDANGVCAFADAKQLEQDMVKVVKQ